MIDLRKFNYFTGEESAVGKAVYQICQIHELAGSMCILFHSRAGSEIGLHHSMQPAHSYHTDSDLLMMLADEGLMFRADIVVIDAWKMSSVRLDRIVSKIKDLGHLFIIISQSYHVVSGDEIAEYTAQSNIVEGKQRNVTGFSVPLKETRIKSKTENWSATTEELKASFVRDKRLDDLLGE